ncbi:hypothetical protein ACQKP0_03210 [Heyndrickxia sp. NPDC080065]|uniref:hypothetical protein n=1 Tax=Heyndrickxia sp. NPDC080065 TaxID=3390568 RepID=UPI003CFC26A4
MLEKYQKITEMMKEIELDFYWKDFKPVAYCLYNKEFVYLFNHPNHSSANNEPYVLPWNEQFIADTCILFEDYPTAIVNVERYENSESIYSLLIHELFHGYQYVIEEKRFPNELLGAQYPIQLENIDLRNKERQLLFKAVLASEKPSKNKLLNEFIFIREQRKDNIGDYAQYEFLVESIEGPAWYIEAKAFQQASNLPFDKVVNNYSPTLIDKKESNVHIRRSCYGSGLFLCLLLDEFSTDWQKKFMQSEKTLYEFFKEFIEIEPLHNMSYQYDYESQEILQFINEERLKIFEEFEKSDGFHLFIEGNLKATSIDPMNIISHGKQLLHQNFIKIQIGETEYYIHQPAIAQYTDAIKNINKLHLNLTNKPKVYDEYIEIDGIGKIKGIYREEDHLLFLNV